MVERRLGSRADLDVEAKTNIPVSVRTPDTQRLEAKLPELPREYTVVQTLRCPVGERGNINTVCRLLTLCWY